MNLHLEMQGIQNLQQELQGIVTTQKIEHTLELGAVIIEAEAKRYCPIKTGRLQLSITHHKRGPLTQEIVASAPYADCIEYGTMAHEIYAKPGGVLAWKDAGGESHFAMHVHHPGIKVGTPENPIKYNTPAKMGFPSYRPFLRSAAYDNFDRITDLFDKEMTP